ncbi:LuxR C-terminal-related transcriptional regulator [Lentzea sp. NBRC 102530]|uniref:LuxR C-terminal-related transcriptional regulator n=1 Tax=Lentzea sp. NBRC 102530 TaxID=3032201 RepID=UPI002556C6C3|nr:LuxR C-terminal-related transcriptional regulator [Lentzea sp. NBRC 102530]
MSDRETAEHIGLAETTVKTHVGSPTAKLQARDRAATTVFARDCDLVLPNRRIAHGPQLTKASSFVVTFLSSPTLVRRC